MDSYLVQCYTLYNDTFPEGWADSISEESEAKRLFDLMDDFSEDAFVLLSKSIICGEYLAIPDFHEQQTHFIESVSQEFNPLSSSNIIDNEKKIWSRFNKLNDSLYNALRYYQDFIEDAKNKFDTTNKENQYFIFQIRDLEVDKQLDLFIKVTIGLCKFDYHLHATKDDFYTLLSWRSRLQNLTKEGSNPDTNEILSTLLLKCNFIIRRLRNTTFYYILDFKNEKIDPDTLELGDLKGFVPPSSYIISQEKINELTEDVRKESPKLSSFVFLMLHYVKSKEASHKEQIDFLIQQFDRYYASLKGVISQSLKEKYDRFSLDSVCNFLSNCKLSFVMEQNPSLKEIEKELRKIEDIQNKTEVQNFYPFKKAIETIIASTEKDLESNRFENKLIEDRLYELDRLISQYEETYKWSREHRFFPFQLPFEESVCACESDNLQLFIPSAHAKRINYDQMQHCLTLFKQQKEYLKYHWELAKERKEVEQLKEGIKQTDKKAMDLIALFTAAITLLFGSVNIFADNKENNLSQLITNTVGLGIILILFMCLYLLISPLLIQKLEIKEYIKTPRCWLGILGVLIYIWLVRDLICIS